MNKDIQNLQKLRENYNLIEERLNISLSAGKLAWWEMTMPEGKVVYDKNKALMLGYDPADFEDCHYSAFTDLIHPADYETAMKAMSDHLTGKTDLYQVTYRIKANDGSYKWFYDRGSVTERDDAGRPLKVKGIVFDDTERIEAGIALEKSRQELKHANATKDKFFSILAHDLRNPFSVIMGMADLLRFNFEDFDKKELMDIFQQIKSTSENAFHLMEDILAWSLSQTGKMSFNPEKLDLKEVVLEAIAPYEASAEKKGVDYQVHIDKDLELYADGYMLKTIIRNLFSNAVKFTYRNGRVSISAREESSKIAVVVEDNGVGMDNDALLKIFAIDKSISTKGTEEEEGTGFGLALCKEFADRHKAKFDVESFKGKGSRFILRLPK